MSIKAWPISERPREKLLARGPDALNDSELLAIFLRTGCSGKSAVDLARELLLRFGSLRALLEADQDTFCQGLGLGQAKFAQLQATLEMGRRHLLCVTKKEHHFQNSKTGRTYLTAQLRHRQQEVFATVFLDKKHRFISYEELFTGTIDAATVYPREILKRVLAHNAAAVIFAHNHPSGVSEPSPSDIALTRQLEQALRLIDVKVLDHFIVGDGEVSSFCELGLIQPT